MKETGIIFTTESVRAILEGRKTQTRRVIKPQPVFFYDDYGQGGYVLTHCPYGQVGDRLWVRETFVFENDMEYGYSEQELAQWAKDRPIKTEDGGYEWGTYHLIPHYRATEPEPHIISGSQDSYDDKTRWTPSIYMPRWASRITLEITEVRVERLQEISEEDVGAEGLQETNEHCAGGKYWCSASGNFILLWDSLNAKRGYSWEVNPWVWVISFATGVRLK